MLLNKPVIILGGGGHARVLIETLRMLKIDILGVSDPNLSEKSMVHGVPVIGSDEALLKYPSSEVELVNGIGPKHKNKNRELLSEKFTDLGFKFCTLVHPQASVSSSVDISNGVQIMAGATVQSGSSLGAMTVINTGAIIDHDCIISSYAHVAPGAVLCGGVKIGSGAFVGSGSVIIENKSIGSNSVLAAGVTLRKNLEDGVIFYG